MAVLIQRREPRTPDHSLGDMPSVLARVLAQRGITCIDELDDSLNGLEHYDGLPDIAVAARLIADAVMLDQSILIVGDYDTDGATATAVMYRALRMMGAKHVQYTVPDRMRHGYGLSPSLINDWLSSNIKPDLLVTVDNGTTAFDGVNLARSLGIKVIVTDHHLPAETLPQADAIVNPNLVGAAFRSKSVAGVGVSFYTMAATRRELKSRDWFTGSRAFPDLSTLLDLVALGTIADVVAMDQNNRRLVASGLRRIRAGHMTPGIKALIEVANRNHLNLTTADFGFTLGPRLNAAGRLESMKVGIDCLVTDDNNEALRLAEQLQQINEERRAEQAKMMNTIGCGTGMQDKERPSGPREWVVHDPSFHQGLIGIVAGNLKEKWNCPVFAFAHADGGLMKGSGRSITGLHLRDILVDIERMNPRLLIAFGGHAMAAGVTIEELNFERFQSAFAAVMSKRSISPVRIIYSDGELPLSSLTMKTAKSIEDIHWGAQFEEPVFDQEFEIIARKPLKGGLHWKLIVRPKHGKRQIDAVWFNIGDALPENTSVRLAYRLSVNRFIGKESLQLIVVDQAVA